MPPMKLIAMVTACFLLPAADGPSTEHLLLSERSAASDLEIAGMAAGIPPDTVRYLSYEQLLTLPQTTVDITDDDNLRAFAQQKLTVTGVYLDDLKHSLNASPESDL